MNKYIIVSLLALASWVNAEPINYQNMSTVNPVGSVGASTGSATYALNNALTGTTSSAIDLGNYDGFYFSVTGTGGIGSVATSISNDNSTWQTFQAYLIGGSYTYKKVARYIKFITSPNANPTGKASVWYYTPDSSGSSPALPTGAATSANQILMATTKVTIALNATTGTAMTASYLTLTAKSALFFDNPSGGTITVQTGTTSTPPVNADGNVVYIQPYSQLNWNMLQGTLVSTSNWLYYGNTNSRTCTAMISY